MLKLHGWFWIHSFEIVMWVVHSDINCNLFFSQLFLFLFLFLTFWTLKLKTVTHLMSKMIERWRYLLGRHPLKAGWEWHLYELNKCPGHVLFQMFKFWTLLAVIVLLHWQIWTLKNAVARAVFRKHDISLCVFTLHFFIMKEFASCICKPRSNLYFNISGTTSVSASLLGKRNIRSHTPEPVERKNAIPLWANRWRWLIPQP